MGKRGPKPRGKAPVQDNLEKEKLLLEIGPLQLIEKVKSHDNFLRLSSQDTRSLLGILDYWAKNQRISDAQVRYLLNILSRLDSGCPRPREVPELSKDNYRKLLAKGR